MIKAIDLNKIILYDSAVYYNIGNNVIVEGVIKYIYIDREYNLSYVVMESAVVYSRNRKYAVGDYVQSKHFKHSDFNKKFFLTKAEMKEKIKEMRKK